MIQEIKLVVPGSEALLFKFDDAEGTDTVALDVMREGMNHYEAPFPVILGTIVAETNADFFDVGANTGIFSLLAATANKSITAYAFEPIPYITNLLRSNIAINTDISSRISVHQCALSDRSGSCSMVEHVNPDGFVATSSSLQVPNDASGAEYKSIAIESTRLDEWMEQHPEAKPGVVKIDVEGHERAFFDGALKTISRFRPIMIVELLGDADFAYFDQFMAKKKYIDIALFPELAAIQTKAQFHQKAWNHLFCPQEKLLRFAEICHDIDLAMSDD